MATLAATAAFAQSSVTLSGNADGGVINHNSQAYGADGFGANVNGSSTSFLAFSGTEDLGGGLSAGFKGVHLINTASGLTNNGATPYQTSNFFNDEIWIGIDQAGVGGIKIGAPNAGMHETNSKSQPFGTAWGGGYTSTAGTVNRLLGSHTALGVNQYVGGTNANGRVIRAEKSIRFDTAVFNGFSANYVYAPGNDRSSTTTSNTNEFTNATVNYSNGPLNLAYSTAQAKGGVDNVAASAASLTAGGAFQTNSALNKNSSVKYTFLAANYTYGPATVYYGKTTGKTNALTGGDKEVSSNNYAIKYALNGNLDLLANSLRVSDKVGTADQSLTAVSAIYKLSKRTSTYATTVRQDLDTSNNNAGRLNSTLLGIRQQF